MYKNNQKIGTAQDAKVKKSKRPSSFAENCSPIREKAVLLRCVYNI